MSQELRKFDPIVTQLRKAVVPMMKMTVTDLASKEQAELALRTIKGYEKAVEEVHGEYKAPILDAGRVLDQTKRDILAELSEPRQKLNSILIGYNTKIRQAQEAARQQIEEERRANELRARQEMERARVIAPDVQTRADEEARVAAAAKAKQNELAQQKAQLNVETVSNVRHNWKFRITDAGAVVDAYMVPDEVAIGKTVRSLGMRAEIAVGGIEVWDEPSVASGSIAPPARGRSLR